MRTYYAQIWSGTVGILEINAAPKGAWRKFDAESASDLLTKIEAEVSPWWTKESTSSEIILIITTDESKCDKCDQHHFFVRPSVRVEFNPDLKLSFINSTASELDDSLDEMGQKFQKEMRDAKAKTPDPSSCRNQDLLTKEDSDLAVHSQRNMMLYAVTVCRSTFEAMEESNEDIGKECVAILEKSLIKTFGSKVYSPKTWGEYRRLLAQLYRECGDRLEKFSKLEL